MITFYVYKIEMLRGEIIHANNKRKKTATKKYYNLRLLIIRPKKKFFLKIIALDLKSQPRLKKSLKRFPLFFQMWRQLEKK